MATQDTLIRILLVDGHLMVLTGLRLLIESQRSMVVVGEATTGADARTLAAAEQPHIILLELDLGSDDSFALLPELLELAPEARIILVTGVRDAEAQRRGIMLGAVGLVPKEKDGATLLRAIEKVYAGEVWLDRVMIASILNAKQRSRPNNEHQTELIKIATLTTRERDIIRLIGTGLKNKQIADQLIISEATVRHHLTSIFAKLGTGDRFELAIYAYKNDLATVPR